MSGYEKRTKDPDFETVLSRVNKAVEKDPTLRERVDRDETAFCNLYDRVASSTRTSRLDAFQAPPRPAPPPSPEDVRTAEEIKRQSMLGKVKNGQIDAAEYLTYLDQNRSEEND